jgi:hypothetical protein
MANKFGKVAYTTTGKGSDTVFKMRMVIEGSNPNLLSLILEIEIFRHLLAKGMPYIINISEDIKIPDKIRQIGFRVDYIFIKRNIDIMRYCADISMHLFRPDLAEQFLS